MRVQGRKPTVTPLERTGEALEEVACKLGLEGDVDIQWADEGGGGEHPGARTEQKHMLRSMARLEPEDMLAGAWREGWKAQNHGGLQAC